MKSAMSGAFLASALPLLVKHTAFDCPDRIFVRVRKDIERDLPP